MKAWLNENWFKVSLLFVLPITAFVLFYGFVLYPEQVREKELQRAEVQKERAMITYDYCISTAQSDYRSTWKSRCADYKELQDAGYQDCLSEPYLSASDCKMIHNGPTEEEALTGDCSLPSSWADSPNESLEDQKDACMQEYQMSL